MRDVGYIKLADRAGLQFFLDRRIDRTYLSLGTGFLEAQRFFGDARLVGIGIKPVATPLWIL